MTGVSAPGDYPYHVVGGSKHRVGSFETIEDAKEYAQLNPAWSVLTPRLVFQCHSKSDKYMSKLNGSAVVVIGVGQGWRLHKKGDRKIGLREYACRFPDGFVYWCWPDELLIPHGKETE